MSQSLRFEPWIVFALSVDEAECEGPAAVILRRPRVVCMFNPAFTLCSLCSVVDTESCFFEGLRAKKEDLIDGRARGDCGVSSSDTERFGRLRVDSLDSVISKPVFSFREVDSRYLERRRSRA